MIAILMLLATQPAGVSTDVPDCPALEASLRALLPAAVTGYVWVGADSGGEPIVELRDPDGQLIGLRKVPTAASCEARARSIALLAEAWSLELALLPLPVRETRAHVPVALPPPTPSRRKAKVEAPAPVLPPLKKVDIFADEVPRRVAPEPPAPPPTILAKPRLRMRPDIEPYRPVYRDLPPIIEPKAERSIGLVVIGMGALAGGLGASFVDTGQPFANAFLPMALYTSGATMLIAALVSM